MLTDVQTPFPGTPLVQDTSLQTVTGPPAELGVVHGLALLLWWCLWWRCRVGAACGAAFGGAADVMLPVCGGAAACGGVAAVVLLPM